MPIEIRRRFDSARERVGHFFPGRGEQGSTLPITVPNRVIFTESDQHIPQVVIFPGQGIQHSGMGKELYDNHQEVRRLYTTAEQILGYSLAEKSFYGTQEELNQTWLTQPAIFVLNHANYLLGRKVYKNEPEFFAGNSLGLLNAYVAAGALTFEEALRLVKARSESMWKACLANPSGLFALTVRDGFSGPKPEDKQALDAFSTRLTEEYGYLEAEISEAQKVFGARNEHMEDIQKAARQFPQVRITPIKASGAFHSPLMLDGVANFALTVANVDMKKPRRPILSNTKKPAVAMTEPQELKRELIEHMWKPVQWKADIDFLEEHGIYVTIEPGDRSILTNALKHKGTIATLGGAGIVAGTVATVFWRRHHRRQNN